MKTIYIFCIVSFVSIQGSKDYELFLSGNQHVKQGNYKKALQDYALIEKQSSSILYNMAVTYYALGDDIHALVCLGKAQRNARSEIANKIKHLQHSIDTKLHIVEENFVQKVLYNLQKDIWLGWTQILFLVLLIILFLRCVQKKYKKHMLKKHGYMIDIVLVLLIIKTSLSLFSYYYMHRPVGIITTDKAIVYVGPSKDFAQITTITGGTRGKLVDENGNWCKMQIHDIKGWVPKEDIVII